MRLLVKKYSFLVLFLLLAVSISAQFIYPITANIQSTPPHSGLLSDLTATGGNKLSLLLNLEDAEELTYQVRLRITIEGNGITLSTKNNLVFTPIDLAYGSPSIIRESDLVEYFDPAAFDFAGYSLNDYLLNGGLPDGFYTICVEAFNYLRFNEAAASNKSCTVINASRLDPPVVIAPIGMQTNINNPQNLPIQWANMHNVAIPVEYEIEIYTWPYSSTLAPDQVIQFDLPFFTTMVSSTTTYVLRPSDPPLESGERYLIRVKAVDLSMNYLFKNQGWSEIHSFSYGHACPAPEDLGADEVTTESIDLSWTSSDDPEDTFVIRYREKIEGSNWYENVEPSNQHLLEGLDDNTTYEIAVQKLCDGTTAGLLTEIIEVTTDSLVFNPQDFDCGDQATFMTPSNQTPIVASELAPGDFIEIVGFRTKILSVEPGNAAGSLKGSCEVKVDWLGKGFYAEFQELYVNSDREVYDGRIICGTNGLNSIQGFVSPDSIQMGRDTSISFCGDTIATDSTKVPTVITEVSDSVFTPLNQPASVSVLPFALTTNSMSGEEYMIALNTMAFSPTGATMNAYMALPVPQSGGGAQYASFSAEGIGFHPGGLLGESRLILNSDLQFKLGPTSLVTLFEGGDTYVSWDCHGFKGVSVNGKVEICRSVIVPIDWEAKGIDTTNFATGYFRATMPEWGEFVADLSMTPFEVPGLEDWAFVVENAVFDFSESLTPASVAFPSDYSHPDVAGTGGSSNPEWTGFYLKALKIRLPNKFSKVGTTQSDTTQSDTSQTNPPIPPPPPLDSTLVDSMNRQIDSLKARIYNKDQLEIGAENVIIDETGVTFYVYASNILSLDQGRVGTWGFGLDSIGLGMQSNQFKHAYLKGKVDVPAINTPLAYVCNVQPGAQYAFSVTIVDTLTINAWAASISLTGGSGIDLVYTDSIDNFSAVATLNGYATINASMKKDTSTTGGNQNNNPPPDSTNQNQGDSTNRLALPNLQFQNLKFMTIWPYVEVGSWAFSSGNQAAASKFPLTINELSLQQNSTKDKVAIVIDASINLKSDTANGFSCSGRLGLISNIRVNPETGKEVWSFERVRIDKFAIDVSTAAFSLKGALLFYENIATYGSGFRAGLQLKVKPGIAVEAIAQFGNVDEYRYFFVDAMVAFGQQGIPLGASGMAIYGFGGGVSYRMRRLGFQELQLPDPTAATPHADTLANPLAGIQQVSFFDPGSGNALTAIPPGVNASDIPIVERLGYSLSGTQYIPDVNTGIGIKAMVAFGAVKKELFYGEVTFEIIMNAGGGLKTIGLQGDLSFLTPPSASGEMDEDPALRATIDMLYDNDNKSFYARLGVFVKVAGGILRGGYDSPPNLAGIGIIYASEEDWYIHLGTPQKPVKVKLDLSSITNMKDKSPPQDSNVPVEFLRAGDADSLGVVVAGLILSAYFDAGTILPPFPDLPDQLLSILGQYRPMQRENSEFSGGRGVLFGAHLAAQMADLKFLFFYAEFYAGLGFDAMLKDYGSTVRCDGIDTDGPIGINGWYATAQVYAYLKGAIGLRIKIFGKEKRFEIISLGAAAVLQGRLPNPVWLKGAVAGSYSILGGLISGSCYFEFEVGDECIFVGGGSPATDFITDIYPVDADENISVFTKPSASFSLALDRIFSWTDLNENSKLYRARLNKFEVIRYDGTPGNMSNVEVIEGELVFNDQKNLAVFTPHDLLPGVSNLRLYVQVEFDEKETFADSWQRLNDENGNVIRDTEVAYFTTREAPDYIPLHNIAYSYPIVNQLFYLQNESNQGYIQLKQGQPYLFKGQPSFALDPAEWDQKVGFAQNNEIVNLFNLNYNAGQKRVSYTMPSGALANETITSIKLLHIPINPPGDIGAQLDSVFISYVDEDMDPALADSFTTRIRENRVIATSEPLRTKSFFDAYFRTSMFDSWTEKVASFNLSNQFSYPIFLNSSSQGSNIDQLIMEVQGPEEFDRAELKGFMTDANGVWIEPLISPQAVLNSTPLNWFDHIQDTLYDHVPNQQITIDWRDPQILYTPPVKAVKARTAVDAPRLTESNVLSNSVQLNNIFSTITYDIHYNSLLDRNELRQDVASYYSTQNTIPDFAQAIIDWDFPWPPFGSYGIKLNYTLPGQSTPSTSIPKTIIYEAY
jgi:hypothetical protein